MPKRNHCIPSIIITRQIYGANARRDLTMIRTLIEGNREYKKVWQKSSKSPISYEGNLFFDNFSTCYDLIGLLDKPRLLYRLPKAPSRSKIEAFLVFESPLDQTTFSCVKRTAYGNGPYSIGLTADNYLKVFDSNCGKTLEQIYLSSHCKFKYLSWETDLERILIKSTLSTHRPPVSGTFRVPRDERTSQVLLYLAVLAVSPLEFLCVLPICKSVFGMDVCNASIRNGLLVVMYSKGKMKFYSFEDILKNNLIPLKLGCHLDHGNKLGLPEMDEFTSGMVGISPIGLPVNVCLSVKPHVLFEVVSHNHDVSLGGFPWHYIQNTNKMCKVKSLKDNILAENGILQSKVMSLELDKAFFHADLSGRILHIGPSAISCLKLGLTSSSDGKTKYTLSQEFVIDYTNSKPSSTPNGFQTKSGRHVKQLFDSYHGNIHSDLVQDVDYDDELDVLVVLYLDQTVKNEGIVGFYDNQTGYALHNFRVNGISEEDEHSLAIDRNVLVIISKSVSCSFTCTVYSLLPGKA